MPLEFLQVMLVQEGGSRSMVAMLQHILREEGVKVDQGFGAELMGEVQCFKGLMSLMIPILGGSNHTKACCKF